MMRRFALRLLKGSIETILAALGWPWLPRVSRLLDRLTVQIEEQHGDA
jgi:hypothetical protein